MPDSNSLKNSDTSFPILERIDSPDDLRELDEEQLPELASELRAFLLQSLSKTGGHLASGLGSVEITIAPSLPDCSDSAALVTRFRIT